MTPSIVCDDVKERKLETEENDELMGKKGTRVFLSLSISKVLIL